VKEPEVPPEKAEQHGKAYRAPINFVSLQPHRDNGIRNLFLNQMIKAKRAGTWFRLRRRERGLFELAMRLDVRFQSHDLLRALVSVLKNLKETCDAGFMALMKATRIAWAFSEAAVRGGYREARQWRNDQDYIRFLASNLDSRWRP
jgi:hypothetical protein